MQNTPCNYISLIPRNRGVFLSLAPVPLIGPIHSFTLAVEAHTSRCLMTGWSCSSNRLITCSFLLMFLPVNRYGPAQPHYRARLQLGASVLAELDSVNSCFYPPMELIVYRSLNETVSVNIGEVFRMRQYISCDLKDSAYSDATTPRDSRIADSNPQ